MNKIVRFALLILTVVYTSSVRPSPARSLADDTWLRGAAGYARAVQLQRELNVPLVVYFYADWCPYCRTLDSRYLPAPEVQDYLQGVVKVRINPEHGPAERDLATRYCVRGYPTFLLMRSPAARPVAIQPFRTIGDLTPAQWINACREAAPVSTKSGRISAGRALERSSEGGLTRSKR